MVPGEGPVPCEIVLLGEAPGAQEEKASRPFIGAAGNELFALLGTWGVSRSEVYVTNVVKERPPENRDPTPEEIETWTPTLVEELGAIRPGLVVALGRFAAQWCLGPGVTMERDYGMVHRWAGVRLPPGCVPPLVLVSYHPAAVLHAPEMYTVFERGLARLKDWPHLEPLEDRCPTPVYQTAPQKPQDAPGWPPTGPVGVDTEGTLESPLGASYALQEGVGCWEPEMHNHTVETRPLGGRGWTRSFDFGHIVLHNALYDLPMLGKLGHVWGLVDDTMLMAHVLGEPRVGLKILAHRHCGMTLTDYSDMIAPAQCRIAEEYLYRLLDAYTPRYQERISEKTGRPLKPKLLAPDPVFRAAARCVLKDNPYTAWRGQSETIHQAAQELVGEMQEATLEDIKE